MTRAVVFANGDCSAYACDIAAVSEKDFLVCVDGGIRHCLAAGLTPDLLVGDFDSLDAASLNAVEDQEIECVRFPPKKDASDLDLTLQTLCDRSIGSVVLLGISGGRTDHLLFNWQLAGSRLWPFSLRIVDDFVDTQLVDRSRPIDIAASIGQIFSVIPLVQNATGVCVSGAMYPLTDAELRLGSTIGLSNEVTESCLHISVKEGVVLTMLVHPQR